MIVTKGIKLKSLIGWSLHHVVWLSVLMSSIAALYYYNIISLVIPWLPVSVIGTAVAFYAGFKNNQAYDRMWEARKIWGGIVNDSRTWGMMVDGFITNTFNNGKLSLTQLKEIKRRLVYRHVAWLYAHRGQLLVSTPWEHANQGGFTGKTAKMYQERFGLGLIDDQVHLGGFAQFLDEEEAKRITAKANSASQIINEQSRDLAALRQENVIDDFRHMEMENVLKSFYTLQGKNERIKKFPLPRQYANLSRYFVGIFICLLPFSMIPSIIGEGSWGIFLSIPITALVGWIYIMMEIVGDYTENPFSGMANDIPMMSLVRTIEIDMREMLEETELPPAIQSKNGVLM